jgi:hypothetical protein
LTRIVAHFTAELEDSRLKQLVGSDKGEGDWGGGGEAGESMLHMFKPRYSGEEAVDLQVRV